MVATDELRMFDSEGEGLKVAITQATIHKDLVAIILNHKNIIMKIRFIVLKTVESLHHSSEMIELADDGVLAITSIVEVYSL